MCSLLTLSLIYLLVIVIILMVFTQSVTLVRILVRASQSVFYSDESGWTGPESSPLVQSGPRFIVYHFLTVYVA